MSVLVCTQAASRRCANAAAARSSTRRRPRRSSRAGLYRLSKHDVVAITAALAQELGGENFKVNSIAPGMIQTEEGFRSAGEVGSEQADRTGRGRAQQAAGPRARRALVGALLLLASDAGDYINGQTLIIDGGRNVRL